MSNKKILLSGVKPTGRPHIGNYFGAMKQFVDMQDEYQAMYMIADYHALNFIQNKEELNGLIIDLAIDYLAIGLDPQKSIIFKQSDVSEHTELAIIFDTITTMPYLQRSHAYKDAEAKDKEINVGTFNYPILMAADILIYDTDIVPLGQDNKQHLEYARDTAQKFNFTFKQELFKLPDARILDSVATVPGTDGRKMSKSYGNTIALFATLEEITKAVMSIPTDSKPIDEPRNPEEDNVFKLHKLFAKPDDLFALRERYEKGGLSHKESKEMLIKNIDAFIAPLREKRDQLAHDTDFILDVLKEGGKRAKVKAERKMEEIRKAIGVKLY
ncbi:MAG: tryptophan--tRNA ligase [Candidatus Pacebacteria bacterium]|jgi:tryptophanyl-tRNA synthetase|nr:tryptophan--tRNA ligase [Candidatus Paceibacterota bacterium]